MVLNLNVYHPIARGMGGGGGGGLGPAQLLNRATPRDEKTSHNEQAVFQAVLALKEAIVREWSLVDSAEIDGLRVYLLTYAVQRPRYLG
jgi:hypothetical protein